jgi:hypothetical protein
LKVEYRHDDAIKIWAYGDLIAEKTEADSGTAYLSSTFSIKKNQTIRLLFKLYENTGKNHFSARIVDESGNDADSLVTQFTAGGMPIEGIINILSPNAGETYYIGDTIALKWVIDPRRLQTGVGAYISLDGGITFVSLTSNEIVEGGPEYVAGDTGILMWEIPDSFYVESDDAWASPVSNNCMMKVYAQYQADTPQDLTGVFAIQPSSTLPFISWKRQTIAIDKIQKGRIIIEGLQKMQTYFVTIIDASGRAILKKCVKGSNSVALQTGHLYTGTYLLCISYNGIKLFKKIVHINK